MKAMILAAGFGTRLRPLTETLPKPLLPIAGKPLIVWNLFLLRQCGVREVIINLHHLGHLIEKELGDGSQFGMRLTYSREPVILGTGGGIKQAEPFFAGEPFLVLNGDTLIDLDLGAVSDFHQRQGALATMVLRDDPDVDRWGVVEVDARHRILRISGRGRADLAPTFMRMFAGVHVMDRRLLQRLSPGRESTIIDAYVDALQREALIVGYGMTGYWSDVGTPERYAQAQQDVGAGLLNLSDRAG